MKFLDMPGATQEDYDNNCVGAKSYHKLALEVIERV